MPCLKQTLSGIKMTEGKNFNICVSGAFHHQGSVIGGYLSAHSQTITNITEINYCINDNYVAFTVCPLSLCRIFNGYDGMEIVNTGSVSKLTFFNMSEGDYGNYTCVAINKLGSSNTNFLLYGE